MKFSTGTPPNTNIFKQTIIKPLNENKQLVFSKKLTISQINQSKYNNISNDNKKEKEIIQFPLAELSDIKNIIDIPNTEN